MAVKTYDFKKVSVIIGSQPLQGFAEGDAVVVERNEDAWLLLNGADGESTRAKNNNRSGRITVNLLSSSASNDYLSGLYSADELGGNTPFGILIKDNSGTSNHAAATAWIAKMPAANFGKEAGTRTWIFETDELVSFHGGN
jgi:Protein of unknown function (DUF3277)